MEELFLQFAQKLLNKSVLVVKDCTYRICEIEMYYCDETEHPDKYTHCDDKQLDYGKIYFHRFKNGTFKSGTYKCMDITFGNRSENIYFGILIRSIMNIDTGEFFCGPCVSVRELLRLYNCSEFKEFVADYDVDTEFKLEKRKLDKLDIFCGPRVGLGDKYPEYKEKNYRFATNIKSIKKQKIWFPIE